jgi:hypothetical protein
VALQERSACAQQHQATAGRRKPVAAEIEARVGQHVPGRRPVGDQFRSEPRKQFLQDLLPSGRKSVDMAAVGDATPVRLRIAQLVTVDHGHVPVPVGEHSGG